MTFRGTDFLALARLLLTIGSDEGTQRTSISRSYYAAMHAARDFCDGNGRAVSTTNTHVALRWCLEEMGYGDIAWNLRDLHDRRKQADYDVPATGTDFAEVAIGALATSEHIISNLNSVS